MEGRIGQNLLQAPGLGRREACADFGGPRRVRKRTRHIPQQQCIFPPYLQLETDDALSLPALAVCGNRCFAVIP